SCLGLPNDMTSQSSPTTCSSFMIAVPSGASVRLRQHPSCQYCNSSVQDRSEKMRKIIDEGGEEDNNSRLSEQILKRSGQFLQYAAATLLLGLVAFSWRSLDYCGPVSAGCTEHYAIDWLVLEMLLDFLLFWLYRNDSGLLYRESSIDAGPCHSAVYSNIRCSVYRNPARRIKHKVGSVAGPEVGE